MNMEIDAHEYWNIGAYEKGQVHVMREIHHHADCGNIDAYQYGNIDA